MGEAVKNRMVQLVVLEAPGVTPCYAGTWLNEPSSGDSNQMLPPLLKLEGVDDSDRKEDRYSSCRT